MTEAAKTDLPPYVVVGEWRDEEWYTAARKIEANAILTPAERYLLMSHGNGPRNHPYGCEAWAREVPFGKVMIFPSEEAHDAWFAIPRS